MNEKYRRILKGYINEVNVGIFVYALLLSIVVILDAVALFTRSKSSDNMLTFIIVFVLAVLFLGYKVITLKKLRKVFEDDMESPRIDIFTGYIYAGGSDMKFNFRSGRNKAFAKLLSKIGLQYYPADWQMSFNQPMFEAANGDEIELRCCLSDKYKQDDLLYNSSFMALVTEDEIDENDEDDLTICPLMQVKYLRNSKVIVEIEPLSFPSYFEQETITFTENGCRDFTKYSAMDMR